MNGIATVNSWLAEIGRHAGTELKLNSAGTIRFAYADQLPVTISVMEETKNVALYSNILPLVGMDTPLLHSVLIQLLTYNLPGGLRSGLAMAADEYAEQVYLVCQQPLHQLEAAGFQTLLGEFMTLAAHLAQELRDMVHTLEENKEPYQQAPIETVPPSPASTNVSVEELLHIQRSSPQLWG